LPNLFGRRLAAALVLFLLAAGASLYIAAPPGGRAEASALAAERLTRVEWADSIYPAECCGAERDGAAWDAQGSRKIAMDASAERRHSAAAPSGDLCRPGEGLRGRRRADLRAARAVARAARSPLGRG